MAGDLGASCEVPHCHQPPRHPGEHDQPEPTVTRATVVVEDSDGTTFTLTTDHAQRVMLTHAPQDKHGDWVDGLDLALPGGPRWLRQVEAEPGKTLRLDLVECPSWRLHLQQRAR
jgi:hypothetical protein